MSFVCVYIISVAGRSVGRPTDLPATDTTYTHTDDMLPHHRNI